MIHEHAIHLLSQHRNHYAEQASALSSRGDAPGVRLNAQWVVEIESAIEALTEDAAERTLNGEPA